MFVLYWLGWDFYFYYYLYEEFATSGLKLNK